MPVRPGVEWMRFFILVLVAWGLLPLGCARLSSPGKAAVEAPESGAHVIPERLVEPYRLGYRAEHLASLEGHLPEALALYQSAWDGGVRHLPRWLFSAAVAAARAGQLEEARVWLTRALDAGFSRETQLKEEPALEALRASPAFAAVLARARENAAAQERAEDPQLRDLLLRMYTLDQGTRRPLISGPVDDAQLELIEAATRVNVVLLKDIIARHGWPTRTKVGERAAHSAWIVAHHANEVDPAFQRECLPLAERAAARGELSLRDWAWLFDRVRVVNGLPQHYGAQLSGGTDEEISAAVAHDPGGTVLRRMHADLGLLPTLDGLAR
jgi:hypothetical protein